MLALRGRSAGADRIAVDARVNDAMLDDAARQTEGFSAREMAKFMASVQAAVYGSAAGSLTPDIFRCAFVLDPFPPCMQPHVGTATNTCLLMP